MSIENNLSVTQKDGNQYVAMDDVRDALGPNSFQDFKTWHVNREIAVINGREFVLSSDYDEYLGQMKPIIQDQDESNSDTMDEDKNPGNVAENQSSTPPPPSTT